MPAMLSSRDRISSNFLLIVKNVVSKSRSRFFLCPIWKKAVVLLFSEPGMKLWRKQWFCFSQSPAWNSEESSDFAFLRARHETQIHITCDTCDTYLLPYLRYLLRCLQYLLRYLRNLPYLQYLLPYLPYLLRYLQYLRILANTCDTYCDTCNTCEYLRYLLRYLQYLRILAILIAILAILANTCDTYCDTCNTCEYLRYLLRYLLIAILAKFVHIFRTRCC